MHNSTNSKRRVANPSHSFSLSAAKLVGRARLLSFFRNIPVYDSRCFGAKSLDPDDPDPSDRASSALRISTILSCAIVKRCSLAVFPSLSRADPAAVLCSSRLGRCYVTDRFVCARGARTAPKTPEEGSRRFVDRKRPSTRRAEGEESSFVQARPSGTTTTTCNIVHSSPLPVSLSLLPSFPRIILILLFRSLRAYALSSTPFSLSLSHSPFIRSFVRSFSLPSRFASAMRAIARSVGNWDHTRETETRRRDATEWWG